nr:hypothetical protein [Tanacetum cinerariifolium]
MRVMDNKQEEGEQMRHLVEVGPYEQKMIQNPDKPDDPMAKIIEPLSKMTGSNKKQYFADIRVMNFIFQGIPNDIYNSVDGCKNAQQMWERIRREIQGDSQEDKLITAMMLLARAITQRYSTPTNNRLRTSSNTKNQAVIQDGRVNIQSNNVGYIEVNDQTIQWVPLTESNSGKPNFQCYNCNTKGRYARDCPQHKVCDAKYLREQMLLAMKDEAGGNLNEKENDFMLDNHYGDDSLKELNATVILMARIQPTHDKVDVEPTYDADALGEVNALQIHLKSRMHSESVHEHTNHAKLKTVINTSNDDQIDFSIIFDDLYVGNNDGIDEHDSNVHDQSVALESLIYNIQKKLKINVA